MCHAQHDKGCQNCVYGAQCNRMQEKSEYVSLNETIELLKKVGIPQAEAFVHTILNEIFNLKERSNLLELIDKKPNNKKPYKCPVCEGCGNLKGKLESHANFKFYMQYACCHVCEGKGIIWS